MFGILSGRKRKILGIVLTQTHAVLALIEHGKHDHVLLEARQFSLADHKILGRQSKIQQLVTIADEIAVSIPFERVNCQVVHVPLHDTDEQVQLAIEEHLEKSGRQPRHDGYFDFASVRAEPFRTSSLLAQSDAYLVCDASRKNVETELDVFAKHAIFPTMLSVEPYALLLGVSAFLSDEQINQNEQLCVLNLTPMWVEFIALDGHGLTFIRRMSLPNLNPSNSFHEQPHNHDDKPWETVIYHIEHVIRDYQLSTGGRCRQLVLLNENDRSSSFSQSLSTYLDLQVVLPSFESNSTFKLASHIDRQALTRSCYSYLLAIGLALGTHHA